jgi:two-component system chemotaxis response regulator CheY
MEPQPPPGNDVLIVEDQPDLRESLADLLELQGYRVDTAANGQEALAHLRGASPPQVILLDLRMPVMDGWAFRHEQQQSPALAVIPVVVVSGEADVGKEARALHAAGHLVKPIDLEALLDLLTRYCQKPAEGLDSPASGELTAPSSRADSNPQGDHAITPCPTRILP